MSTPLEVARSRYRSQQVLAGRARVRARRVWRSLDPADLSGSWERQIGALLASVTQMQGEAAGGAVAYHERQMAAQGGDVDFAGSLNPTAFAGVAADGRPLDSLLYQPVIEAKTLIGRGTSQPDALRRSGLSFVTLAAQQVVDAGRIADGVATFNNAHSTGYYRMLQTPSCSRCAILAGKWYARSAGFDRHPRCDCVHVPVSEADDSLAFDTRKAVEQGQIRGLSDAETRAILDGADPSQVVNARRGMQPGGLYTTEGTTRRGIAGARILTGDPTAFIAPRSLAEGATVRGQQFARRTTRGRIQTYSYRRTRTPRPTPEAIYRFTPDRDEALGLLRRFGYIL